MPFYEIQHSYPLTPAQKQALAERITTLHATTFSAPALFVNIQFVSVRSDEDYFYGGKRRPGTNRIFAHVRAGPGRSVEVFDRLGGDMEGIWDEVVGGGGREGEKVLHAVFIVPGIVAREQGFVIPSAGQEGRWINENWNVFKERADAGDEGMKDFIEDVERRPELRQ